MPRALPVKSFTLKGPDPPSTFRSPSPNCRHAHAAALRHQDARLTSPGLRDIPLPNVSLAPPIPLLPLQLSIPIIHTRHWGLVHPRPRRASAFAHYKRRERIFKGSTLDLAPCVSSKERSARDTGHHGFEQCRRLRVEQLQRLCASAVAKPHCVTR
jgi:hypothetical protein